MRGGGIVIRVNKNNKTKTEGPDEKDTSLLAPILETAKKAHGDKFDASVVADMTATGDPIAEATIRRPDDIVAHPLVPGEIAGVAVKEPALQVTTDRTGMPAGMFRSLSLLFQVAHYTMSNKSGCILKDDIGEGLDCGRSCVLIDLIREGVRQPSFRPITSANNRFVTNKVPLGEWCLLERVGGRVRVRNYAGSAGAFERFERTGLNNFDLPATNYLQGK